MLPPKPRVHLPRVVFEYLFLVRFTQPVDRIQVAPGVVVAVTCLRIDLAHGADQFRGEQDVVERDNLEQQLDARAVVDAGVQEYVLE